MYGTYYTHLEVILGAAAPLYQALIAWHQAFHTWSVARRKSKASRRACCQPTKKKLKMKTPVQYTVRISTQRTV